MKARSDTPDISGVAPSEVELRRWMERMIAAVRFVELVAAIVSLIVRMRDLNSELVRQVANLRRRRPPSEKLDRLEGQLRLAFPDVIAAPRPKPVGDADPKKKERRGNHPGRGGLPAHLPRIAVPNPVPAALRICPECGAEMTTVGHSICETLDIIPAQLVVRQRIDETVACPNDESIVSAPPPPELVPRGKLAHGLIVETLLDKYVEHQPIERQATRWRRSGVDIASQTLGRSVAAAIDAMAPLVELIHERTRGCELLATDATGLRVLDRDHPEGVRSGTIWCWIGDTRWVSFVYAPSGDAAGFESFLDGDVGRTIQCDGSSVMNGVEKKGGRRPGCWAHARRRLVEAARGGDLDALEGLRIIRRLFAIERLSRIKCDTPAERRARRLEHSKPVLDELAAWIAEKRATVPPKTPLGNALGYMHRQWKRLVLFLEDGSIPLTNNHVERELRRLVLGKRNWLFVDGDLNGMRTAAVLTILGTCIAQGINPRAYVHLVTRLIVEKWPRARYAELLPEALAARHPELRLPSPSPHALLRAARATDIDRLQKRPS